MQSSTIHDEIAALLEDTTGSLIETYLAVQQLSEKRYGEDTIVVMEVGSFFEIYGVDNEDGTIGKPKEVAEILNLQLTRKNKAILENSAKNPLLAGFPGASFDRYMQRLLQEERYTIVLIRQRGVPPKVERYVDRIISPGVNVDYALDHDDNYITSLVVDRNQKDQQYSVGFAAIDVTTGRTVIQELYGTPEDPTIALDEVFRLLRSYPTSELLVLPASEQVDMQEVLEYLERRDSGTVKFAEKRLANEYQNELFQMVYKMQSPLSPIEFLDLERSPLAAESLALLLTFVIEHDRQAIANLSQPEVLQSERYMLLGNNPMHQLQILPTGNHIGSGKEMSVIEQMDFTTTSLGRRLLRTRIVNPIIDAKEIERRYELAETIVPHLDAIRGELQNVYDLERLVRRLQMGRLHPFEMNFIYDSQQAGSAIHSLSPSENLEMSVLEDCRAYIERTFQLDSTAAVNTAQISGTFFNEGFHAELDALVQQEQDLLSELNQIRDGVLAMIESHSGKEEGDYVLLKQLDVAGHYIHVTKSRYTFLQDAVKAATEAAANHEQSGPAAHVTGTEHPLSDLCFAVQTTNVKITSLQIDQLSEQIVLTQTKITALVKELYAQQLAQCAERYGTVLTQLAQWLADIDVAVSTARSKTALNLCRPEMIPTSAGARGSGAGSAQHNQYLELLQLRHPLVEAREANGIYVPNDVVLGNREHLSKAATETLLTSLSSTDMRGLLLYGINSSGKSSLMKSVGIAIILAQAGLYVPAKQMRFTIFHELFTRIVARDHIERGLSSFAVEMLELKNMLLRSGPRSLVIGDEISHGTETLSAVAIVSAAIQQLHESGALFLFATHLHELQQVKQLETLHAVSSVHMGVHYDAENDRVIFDRTLQQGSGSTLYGLEFAQSLHMGHDFIEKASAIRKELANDYDALELLTQQQTSKYNKELYLTGCAVCNDPVEDTHHIAEQHTADEHGNIEHFHKDHKFNLIPLCKSCHQKAHAGQLKINGFLMTSDGVQLQYELEGEEAEPSTT